MCCKAGRVRPSQVSNTETNIKHGQRPLSTENRVSNDSGFYISGSHTPTDNTILTPAERNLGKTSHTHTGDPRVTRYSQINYRHCKFFRLAITTNSSEGDRRAKKTKKKNGTTCFQDFRRCRREFISQSRWLAFLIFFALLEAKAGMSPRVAAFRLDGRQVLSLNPKEDLYHLKTGSKSNGTTSTLSRPVFFTNGAVRKTNLSTWNILTPAVGRPFHPRDTRRGSPDVARASEHRQAAGKLYFQNKTHHQHYNYFHPHYHKGNEHHRPRYHNRSLHELVLQGKHEKPQKGEEDFILATKEGDPESEYGHRMRRSADIDKELDPLERLSRVFGIRRIPSQGGTFSNQVPPEYMTRLYRSVTDSGGLTKTNGPYNADIVRSFPDRDYRHQMHFFYNVSFLESNERILQAEFHLFKLRPKAPQPKKTNNPHLLSVEIHQVTSLKDVYSPGNLKLIDMRRVSAYSHGWIKFSVLKAVTSWVNETSPNYGFLVRATSLSGETFNGSLIRFAQRREHHDTKQPILVVFTDDGLQRHRNFISPNDEGYQEIKEDILRHEQQENHERDPELQKAIRLLNEKERNKYQQQKHGSYWSQGLMRKRRSAPNVRGGRNSTSGSSHGRNRRTLFRRKRRNCARYEMYVDFNAIGWSGWIISPKGYNAYHCSGPCPFPLGQSHKPTNHATVQSIVHALRASKNVLTPCCVPDKLYSISLLYFDDHENVILKLYEDMVAASCGCH